jgi:cytidine deaminase
VAAVSPCGACRQFIAEFGLDWKIIIIKNRNEYQEYKVRDILPLAFDNSMLELHRIKALELESKD